VVKEKKEPFADRDEGTTAAKCQKEKTLREPQKSEVDRRLALQVRNGE